MTILEVLVVFVHVGLSIDNDQLVMSTWTRIYIQSWVQSCHSPFFFSLKIIMTAAPFSNNFSSSALGLHPLHVVMRWYRLWYWLRIPHTYNIVFKNVNNPSIEQRDGEVADQGTRDQTFGSNYLPSDFGYFPCRNGRTWRIIPTNSIKVDMVGIFGDDGIYT